MPAASLACPPFLRSATAVVMRAVVVFAVVPPAFAGDAADGKKNSAETGLVNVTVRDFDTRDPLGARVYLVTGDGSHHFPESSDSEGTVVIYNVERSPASFEKHATVSAHPFAYHVPKGQNLELRVERGKEYLPASL
ncbi:MAG: hypothetical protein EHM42_07380, partial [Planctomycetaceae bacterium]